MWRYHQGVRDKEVVMNSRVCQSYQGTYVDYHSERCMSIDVPCSNMCVLIVRVGEGGPWKRYLEWVM